MKSTHSARRFWQSTAALLILFSLLLGTRADRTLAQSGLSLQSAYTFPANTYPTALVYGPQDALWLTLGKANAVGKLNLPAGWQPAALPAANARPFDITIGPDASLWFTQQAGNAIGRLDASGIITEYPLPQTGAYPTQIVSGQDGGLWFTEFLGNRIGRMDLDGSLREYPLPNADSRPLGIASGLDGELWFTEWNGRRIGRISSSGEMMEYPIGSGSARPTEIALGPDGAMWFIFEIGQTVGRIDPAAGVITLYSLSTGSTSFLDLVTGPDGKLWLLGTQSVIRMSLPVGSPPVLETLSIPGIYESEGRSQIIAGPGAWLYFITGNSQEVRQVNMESAELRDVQVFIHPFPAVMLMGGTFQVDIEIANWSSAPATNMVIDIPLPENSHLLSADVPGLTCTETGAQVQCSLASLAGGQRITVPFFFHFERIAVNRTTRSFEVNVSMDQADYLAANNRAVRGLVFQRSIDYFNDFSTGADDHWSDMRISNVGELEYLGGFDNQDVRLTFTNLPHHDRAELCFDLYVLGGWDGEQLTDPASQAEPPPVIGPDLWAYYLDETKVRVTTYSNTRQLLQSFPAEYNEGIFPAQQDASSTGNFDHDPAVTDSRYHLCVTRLHEQPDLKYTFYGTNLDALTGERWALDNVFVRLYYHAAYEWVFLPLLRR